jgi:hypothetical protein
LISAVSITDGIYDTYRVYLASGRWTVTYELHVYRGTSEMHENASRLASGRRNIVVGPGHSIYKLEHIAHEVPYGSVCFFVVLGGMLDARIS